MLVDIQPKSLNMFNNCLEGTQILVYLSVTLPPLKRVFFFFFSLQIDTQDENSLLFWMILEYCLAPKHIRNLHEAASSLLHNETGF